jgi:hypothetical protein
MLVLAITLILVVVFFLYVRQKLLMFENRLDLMSDTIQTMAGVTRAALQDDSDEESDESSDSESTDSESSEQIQLDFEETRDVTPERVTVSDDDVKKVSLPENEIIEEIEVKKMVLSDLNEVVDVEVKQIPTSLETLTLKELKDKVAELNGPKLKTKKDLIEFLQNKI